MDHLFVGQIVHTKSFTDFEIITDGFIAVQNGKVVFLKFLFLIIY